MPHSQTNRAPGFTLIEVLVISPIIVLFIGLFIGVIVSLTGDSLQIRAKNSMAAGVQDALDTMEEDINRAVNFPLSLNTTIAKPPLGFTGTANNGPITLQGSGTSATSTTGPLIVRLPATTTNPLSPSRQLVHKNTNGCASPNLETNEYLSSYVVYFLNNSTLWRRTIIDNSVAPSSLCTSPWQRNSCITSDYESGGNGGVCTAEDSKLADNVTGFSLSYYDSATSSSALGLRWEDDDPPSTVNIAVNASRNVAGETVNFNAAVRASSINIR